MARLAERRRRGRGERSRPCYRTRSRPGEIARPPRLMAAMRHATLAGGKRLRPFLVVETARLLGRDDPGPLAGRLRGRTPALLLARPRRPAVHGRRRPAARAADASTRPSTRRPRSLPATPCRRSPSSVLADPATDPDPRDAHRPRPRLARAGGLGGMAGGQMLDLAAEGRYGEAPLDARRHPAAPGHEDRRDPRLFGRGGRDARPRREAAARASPPMGRRSAPPSRSPTTSSIGKRRATRWASAPARIWRRARRRSSTSSAWKARGGNASGLSVRRSGRSKPFRRAAEALRQAVALYDRASRLTGSLRPRRKSGTERPMEER